MAKIVCTLTVVYDEDDIVKEGEEISERVLFKRCKLKMLDEICNSFDEPLDIDKVECTRVEE